MLNYHHTKPLYSEAQHDKFLTDPQWLKGVALLEEFNLSFEMHVLPAQMHRYRCTAALLVNALSGENMCLYQFSASIFFVKGSWKA